MTDQTQQLEDLLTALATLTEHNNELQEVITTHGTASNEQLKAQTTLVSQLTAQLKEYQAKDKHLTDTTIDAIQKAVNDVFRKNQEDYHTAINKGFTTHIEQLTEELLQVSSNIKQQLVQLKEDAKQTQKEFEHRNTHILAYESAYKEQSDKLKQSVAKTLNEVSEDTQSRLDTLSAEYVNSLTWKTTLIFGAVCFSIVLLSFFVAWLFIPSKAEIAERRASYATLERYSLADNVVKGENGYYADVIQSSCFKANDGHFYCKYR